jgi:hypothetical protein
MPGVADALLITAVAVVVIARQFRPQRIDARRRWWLVPAILAALALREPGLLDAHHPVTSALLAGAELVVAVGTGCGWAWTTRIHMADDGSVWARSTRASAGVWAAGVALRVGLVLLGIPLGVHQDGSALLLSAAALLLVRSGILARRARPLTGGAATRPAYGDGGAPPVGQERV